MNDSFHSLSPAPSGDSSEDAASSDAASSDVASSDSLASGSAQADGGSRGHQSSVDDLDVPEPFREAVEHLRRQVEDAVATIDALRRTNERLRQKIDELSERPTVPEGESFVVLDGTTDTLRRQIQHFIDVIDAHLEKTPASGLTGDADGEALETAEPDGDGKANSHASEPEASSPGDADSGAALEDASDQDGPAASHGGAGGSRDTPPGSPAPGGSDTGGSNTSGSNTSAQSSNQAANAQTPDSRSTDKQPSERTPDPDPDPEDAMRYPPRMLSPGLSPRRAAEDTPPDDD